MYSPLLPPSRPSPIHSYPGRSAARSFSWGYNPSCVPIRSGATLRMQSRMIGWRAVQAFGGDALAYRRLKVMTRSVMSSAGGRRVHAAAPLVRESSRQPATNADENRNRSFAMDPRDFDDL